MVKKENKESPPCTVTNLNEPNFELMARAFLNLYEITRKLKEDNEKGK